ncbi:MAG: hypothetical protein Q4F05_03885 [bacterium]|nr:hypothetical protein [bacterium]
MKKTWTAPNMEELSIKDTANGLEPNKEFDADWVQINGLWYKPGNGSAK